MSNNSRNEKKGVYEIEQVTIRTVDQAVKDYFEKKLAISVDGGDQGRKKVPVIFASPERWKAIRDGGGHRDTNGTLILPLISVYRRNINRDRGFGGMASEVPYVTVSRKLSNRTSEIQNLLQTRYNNGFPEPKKDVAVYEYLTVPFPDFCTVYYDIAIWTQYQSQMNEILEKIFYRYDYMDSFVMPVNYDEKMKPSGKGFYFVGFREGDVSSTSNVEDFTDDERVIKTLYSIKVPVYLILSPPDEPLAYGKDKGDVNSSGRPVVYKQQSTTTITLGESPINLSDFLKTTK